MSVKTRVGGLLKLLILTPIMLIGGWNLNRKLYLTFRSSYARSVNPPCPACSRGVLMRQSHDNEGKGKNAEPADDETLYTWLCSEFNHKSTPCDFALFDVRNPNKVRATVARLRKDKAQAAFSEFAQKERDLMSRRHARNSRIFFAFSALVFTNFVYMVALGAPFMIAMNWICVAFMLWVFGMKASYRSWQVSEGHIFEEGAFWFWLRQEKWLR